MPPLPSYNFNISEIAYAVKTNSEKETSKCRTFHSLFPNMNFGNGSDKIFFRNCRIMASYLFLWPLTSLEALNYSQGNIFTKKYI